jgi:hypothetical protein
MLAVDWRGVAERSLALIIILLFFALIFSKIRGRTMGESWDEIKNWVGKGET